MAIREGSWKYLEHGNTRFLFSLDDDISDWHDLFYEHIDRARRLRADLHAWQDSMLND